ncbi:MAG: L-ribulose-5-phosphate 4-epimerase [Kiritimatiellia bacterium]|jgi:L-ribulose-5-phosphate 4-epimerase
MYAELKRAVFEANLALVRHGLVTLTWGNVSGIDRQRDCVAIKPSGVAYDTMTPDDIVVVSLDGAPVEGALRPSSDLPTHLALYRAFPSLGGVVHTHSTHATAFAQASRPVPCLGTTHADHFHGDVPCTRFLAPDEVAGDYERNTGRVIVERFQGLDPDALPGALVAGHGSFTWGPTPAKAVENAVALEAFARMAILTEALAPAAAPLPAYILDKHYRRKHGATAYYGQK